MQENELLKRVEFNMQVCNACRYCESFCAVFPAMERRLTFSEPDLHYLANLCHGCSSCFYACQFAPPHEFDVNLPRYLAELRGVTYRNHAWPRALGSLFERNGVVVSLVTAVAFALFLLATFIFQDPAIVLSAHVGEGAFYEVIPHGVMVWTFGLVALYVLAAFIIGFTRFWRSMGEGISDFFHPVALGRAVWDVLQLKYLDGGGPGCTYPGERPERSRRWFHHFTFYGFMLCFAATCVATVYHYAFSWEAPYGFSSLPVLLGTAGGIGLIIGPAGLLWLKGRQDPAIAAAAQRGMDAGFLVLLVLTSATGLALLFLRETPAMGTLLAVHLGIVLALFATLPYGKFVHGIYRFAALVRYALERSRPLTNVTFD